MTTPEALLAEAAAAEMEFGRDPRRAPPWITENRELLEELEASSKPTKKGMSSASPRVSSLVTLSDFEAALAHAVAAERDAALTSDKSHAAVSLVGRRRRFVAIKFYSTSCRACKNMKPLYEKAAEGALGDYIDFYEVDMGAARVLCSLANIDSVPVIHLYDREGELVETAQVHKIPLFRDFAKSLAKRSHAPKEALDFFYAWIPPPGFVEGPLITFSD